MQFDIASMMAQCLDGSLGVPDGFLSRALDDLWGAFISLEMMHGLLKAADNPNSKQSLLPAERRQLRLRWSRLNSLVKRVREDLKEGGRHGSDEGYEIIH
jgi:hypothetical protein